MLISARPTPRNIPARTSESQATNFIAPFPAFVGCEVSAVEVPLLEVLLVALRGKLVLVLELDDGTEVVLVDDSVCAEEALSVVVAGGIENGGTESVLELLGAVHVQTPRRSVRFVQ